MQILIAVDLAKGGCEWLVDRGAQFAAAVQGKVDLLYVTASPAVHEAALHTLLTRVPERWRGRTHLPGGDVIETLVRTTSAYDVLVVGPREPGMIEMMLRGSFAMRVVREANSAVFIPKRETAWEGPPKCLAGLDLANPGRVLDPAARWVKRLGGKLDLVSAEAMLPWIENTDTREDLERAYAQQRAGTREKVTKIIDALDPAVRGHQRYADGKPEDVLVDLSREYDITMVGNASRAGFQGPLQWSIGEAVIRGAKSDVLTLPSLR